MFHCNCNLNLKCNHYLKPQTTFYSRLVYRKVTQTANHAPADDHSATLFSVNDRPCIELAAALA